MLALALALDPVPATPAAEASVRAAARVVRDLYAALDRHDYRRAFAIWNGGRGYAAYRAGYRQTMRTHVTLVPPFTTDAGMGQVWSKIDVVVDARLDDGRLQRFRGSYTLRRVNDVDGATAAQRRWHIASAKLKAVPAGA